MRYLVIFALQILSLASAQGQKPTQLIRGYIFDGISREPVEDVEVYLSQTDPLIGTVTDLDGKFALDQVPVGRYTVVVRHIGYELFKENVIVEGGKPVYIEVALVPSFNELDPVIVTEVPFITDVNTLGKRDVTNEQARRFAANYLDPARVMITFPGVVPQNDQNNNLVINGKSPNGLLWRVEGLDVLNPNHLANAGTMSDRPTQHGGGVNMLSMQMLGKTSFVTAPFSAEYGNVLSGVMEMNFRPGNKQAYNYTAQASLIGLDLAAEGPLKKDRSSFLVNYRYSTVGLLTSMGVDFGGERINFQDLAFHLDFDQKNGGKLSVFGYGGNSNNVFEGILNAEEWQEDKDSTAVDYASASATVGFNEVLPVGYNSSLTIGSAFSMTGNERTAQALSRDGSTTPAERYARDSWLLSTKAEYASRLSLSSQVKAGVMVNFSGDELLAEEQYTGRGRLIDARGRGALLQPYFSFNKRFNDHLSLGGGLRYMYYSFNETAAFLPAMNISYSGSGRHLWQLGYSHQAQLQTPEIYFSATNQALEMNKMHHVGLAYTRIFKRTLFTSQLFYERLYNIPVSASRESSLSALNQINGYMLEPLENAGTGKIYGVNLSYERPVSNGFYYLVSGSLFESVYKGSDGIERNSRFNNNYTFSLTAGKEIVKEKDGGAVKITGINGRLFYAGGLWTSPVDEAISRRQGRTFFTGRKAFSQRLGDYFRVDLRLSFRKEKSNYTRVFAIDIQNLLSIENDGFKYYDFRKNKVVIKKQLGIIPVLVYRVEF